MKSMLSSSLNRGLFNCSCYTVGRAGSMIGLMKHGKLSLYLYINMQVTLVLTYIASGSQERHVF